MIINKSLAKVYSDIAALDTVVDSGFTAGAKEASLAPLATSAEIATLDGVVDAGFVAGAKEASLATLATSAEVAALDAVVDAGFVAGAKEASLATLATSAEIATLDGVVDAGFTAGAKSTQVDTLEANVGDASAHSLISVVAKLGDDASTVKARLDAIDSAIAAIPTGWTSGEAKGSFSYLIAGGEQEVFELTITDRKTIQGVWLDLNAAAQNGTIKVYYKVDGVNYRLVTSEIFTVGVDPVAVYLDLNMGVTDNFKVSYEAAVAEAISIPYLAVWEEIQ